jgi:hypothetical protein
MLKRVLSEKHRNQWKGPNAQGFDNLGTEKQKQNKSGLDRCTEPVKYP